jgi:Monomeric isocitrate dehydrogenase
VSGPQARDNIRETVPYRPGSKEREIMELGDKSAPVAAVGSTGGGGGAEIAPSGDIIYTYTDEAPALATYSLLPVIQAYASTAGVTVETRDISLAGRILAVFPEYLREEQRIPDALAELGELVKTPEANVIKLPNISGLGPAAEGGHRRAAGAGLRAAGLSGRPGDR